MKYTNNRNLPAPLVRAIMRDSYSRGDAVISATGLLRPPRMAALFDTFDELIEHDVSNDVWSLFGRVVHHILEMGEDEGYITEERLFASCEGWRVSGQLDVQEIQPDGSRVIIDWKTRKAFGVMSDNNTDESQLNIYRWLAEENGIHVSGLRIVNLIKDWSRHEAERREGYPDSDVFIQDIPMWKRDYADAYVRERVLLHQRARDGHLPDCTPDERWLRDEAFAVNKEGRKRAVRIFDSNAEAETFIAALPNADKHSVEHRPGLNTRCETFCDVAEFCLQFQSLKASQL